MSLERQGALGDFLRSRRAKLTPQDVGLPEGRRRRTPGLRREEVAEMAGIGVDWYVRLEQGRAVTPSAATLDALASALRLGRVERVHLKTLARNAGLPAFVRETVPAAIRRLVEGLDQPAYVTGRRWDVLAWNAAAADVLTDFSQTAEVDRNILVYLLTTDDARRRFGAAWADEARRAVALFRTTHDLWSHDPAFVELIDRLQRDCPEFPPWWRTHDIRVGSAGCKTLHHPRKGALHFEYATFQATEDAGLKLAIYTRVNR